MLDSEHNSTAWGFGFSGRVEKSLGHVLGVLDVVRHQSMLFAESEWAVRVIDIRQASVISLGGLRSEEWSRDVNNFYFFTFSTDE